MGRMCRRGTVKLVVRCGAERSARSAVPLVAVGCGLVLALGGCSGSSGTAAAAAARPSPGSAYTLMQMNLCLSGLGGCYARVKYPAVVREAITRVREARPDAVTFNEACSGDVALIAQRTGYHLRFSKVIYNGKPLPCRQPGGRGFFGDAVLSRPPILSAASQPFEAQAGPERREWMCVSIQIGIDVCTAHLAAHEPVEAAANELQCGQLPWVTLAAILRSSQITVVWPPPALSVTSTEGRSARPEPGLAVEELAGDIQVTGMARGFLDHVQHDPAHIRRFVSPGNAVPA